MNVFFVTVGIAFAIIVFSLILLGIGRVITGKSRLQLGKCGHVPSQKQGEEEGCSSTRSCSLCDPTEEKKED